VNPQTETTRAATDVAEFISDLDGGVFERKLSTALSQVAAAVVDNDRAGEVKVSFKFERIKGSGQVHCKHELKFIRPTLDGKASEEENRSTPLHVGKNGRLTLMPESQMSFIDKRTGEIKSA
jgi:hypothetical protein